MHSQSLLFFLGPTHFESGKWCGVELDLPEGKNNGQISGTDYFHCLPNHGLFVPSHCVELLKDIQPKRFESFLFIYDKKGDMKIHSLCFKSNTVKKRLVSHFDSFIVVA